jgi:mono/diheme cytochrome c family protein
MSTSPIVRLAVALMLVGSLAVMRCALADPASSPQSAWRKSTLKADPGLKDPLVRRGKEVFDARCQACHGAYSKPQGVSVFTMPQMPGTYTLELKYKGQKPALLEERTDLTPEAVAVFVRHGGGGFMPAFRPTEVSDEDLKALGAYLARKR